MPKGPEGEPTGGEQNIQAEKESPEEWKKATTLIDSRESRDDESIKREEATQEFQKENPRPSDEAILESRVVDGSYELRWNTESDAEIK